MTVYVIDNANNPRLFDVTQADIKFHNPHLGAERLPAYSDPAEQLKCLQSLPLDAGDIICFAGIALRRHTWLMKDIAVERSWNLMPGQIVDHRLVPIEAGKAFKRRPQDMNNHVGSPYVMIIGNPLTAVESWSMIQNFAPEDVWPQYLPEQPTIHHWLSATAALCPGWLTPDWFPVVDTSVRDLEIAPVMYASNHWTDWIAFYPANGNFKLENHSQLYPVWLDETEKPLEYWHNE